MSRKAVSIIININKRQQWRTSINPDKEEIPAVDEACVAIFWPPLGFKGWAFESVRFSTEVTLVSASAVLHCGFNSEKQPTMLWSALERRPVKTAMKKPSHLGNFRLRMRLNTKVHKLHQTVSLSPVFWWKLLKIPKRKLKSFGQRSFSFMAPSLWNSLPATLKNVSTISQFKSHVKIFLFAQAFQ